MADFPRFQIDPSEKFPHLNRAPIIEAVIEIRAKALNSLDESTLSMTLKEQLADYPIQQPQRQMEASLLLRPAAEARLKDAGWHGIRAISQDELQIADFQRGRFAFSRLEPYQNWNAFESETLRIWRIYRDLAVPDEIHRLGVRFINQFTASISDKQKFQILRSVPIQPAGLESLPVRGFLHTEDLEVPGHPYHIRLTRTVQPAEQESSDSARLILDIDVFTTHPLKVEEKALTSSLREMRWLKNKAFFGSVSASAVQFLEGKA